MVVVEAQPRDDPEAGRGVPLRFHVGGRRGVVEGADDVDHLRRHGRADGPAVARKRQVVVACPVVAEHEVEPGRQRERGAEAPVEVLAPVKAVVALVAPERARRDTLIAVAVRPRQARVPSARGGDPFAHHVVKADVRVGLQLDGRILSEDLQVVAAAVGEQPDAPATGQVLVGPGLVVPVDRNHGDERRADPRRDEIGQQRVDVAAADGKARAHAARQRALDERRCIAQVDVGRPVQRAADVAPEVDVDEAADEAAVADAEPARVEVDLVDQVVREHRRPGQEVIEDRDRLATDEDAGVGRVGAAHDQQAEAEGGARHAGHVLQHAQRIADGAGDGRQLRLGQGLLGLFRMLGLCPDARLVEPAGAFAREAAPLDRGRTAQLGGREVTHARVMRRVGDDHAQRAGRADANLEAPIFVGRPHHLGRQVAAVQCRPAADDGDVGAGERLARSALTHLTAHDDACRRRGNRRRWRGPASGPTSPASGTPPSVGTGLGTVLG